MRLKEYMKERKTELFEKEKEEIEKKIDKFFEIKNRINGMWPERNLKITKQAIQIKNIIDEDYENGIIALSLIMAGYEMIRKEI